MEGGQWFGAFTAVYVDDPGDLETGPESPDLEMELRQ